jgi:hypothetical protein
MEGKLIPGAVAAAVGSAVTSAVVGTTILGMTIGTMAAAVIGGIASFITSYVMSAVFGLNKAPKASSRGGGGAMQRNQDRTISVRQPVAARRVIYGEIRVGGVITFLHTTDDNKYLHQMVTMSGHEVNSIGQIYLDDKPAAVSSNTVTDTTFADFIDIYNGLGTTSGDASLNSALTSNTSSKWTTAHKQSDCAKLYMRFKFDQDAFSGSLPNVTALVEGRKVFDPRDSSTSYSNNSALCIRDYLTNTSFGLGEPTSRINETSFTTAANICDEDVTLTAGGTEKRYTTNGAFETSEAPKDVIKQLLSSCAGRLVYQNGKWSLYAGAYVAPSITLDESDLDGGLQITAQVGRRNIFNTARSVYVEPTNLYQPTDAPVIKNATYLTEDQEEVIARDFDWSFTTSSATAQRLAKIELEKVRQQISLLMPVSLKNGMRLQAGDSVSVNNTRMGWSSKVFLIEEWGFAQRGSAEAPTLGVDLVLRETSSSVYLWASGEETSVDTAPDTDLPNPFIVATPTNLSINEELYITTNGSGVKVRANLSWTASADEFVKDYETEYKLSSASTWIQGGKSFGGSLTAPVNDVALGIFDFRVRAINTMGVRSSYLTLTNQTIAGLTANPVDVTGLSVIALNSQAHLSWDLATDLDVRHGGKIRFRHSNLTDGTAQWESSTDIGASISGHNSEATLPLLSGSYMARFVDSTGNESLGTASFAITNVPNMNSMNLVHTVSTHPDFTGTLVGLDVVDGVLKFESITNMDDRTNLLDTWAFWDSYNTGVDQAGTYEFDGVDLGSVLTSRVTHDLSFNTYLIGDYLDSRSGNVDSYQDWDNQPADLNIDLYVSTTNDQVSGSPTWSAWAKFKTGDFTCRGYRFKLIASSNDSDHQFNVTALSISIDMPDRVQGVRNITSGASTKSVTYPSTFYVIPSLGISANNLASGDYFEVANEAITGFDVTFRNSSGSAISRTFNYQSKGY